MLSPAADSPAKVQPERSFTQRWGFWGAVAVLAIVIALPLPAGLPLAGKYMLGVFLFAVVLWTTEAVDYAVSAVMVGLLIAVLLGISPDPAHPTHSLGTGAALSLAMDGFTNTGLVLLSAAYFIAAAMEITALDKRIALKVLSIVGAGTHRVVIAAIVAPMVLAFFLPTSSSRVACLMPVMMGIIATFGVDRKSRFAGLLMIAVAQSSSIWMIGIKTAAAQNLVTTGFMQKLLNADVTWIDWLVAGAPWSIVMSVALYAILIKMMPPEVEQVSGGNEAIGKALAALGPMTMAQRKLLAISVTLLGFWVTEGTLHHFDTATTTVAAIALMFVPGVDILQWKQTERRIPWGTILLLGIGLGLGGALLKTDAAGWLIGLVINGSDLQHWSAFTMFAVLSLFLIVIHLGFASAPAVTATMIPIMIGILQHMQTPGINIAGMTMLLGMVTGFGFILPVNAPGNMLALGTGTFEVRDFVRTGIVITIASYALLLLFAATYWKWLGYM